jgi:crotonobetainyl-CoA:carnitine CoA-transferase CaiB-like acyl-CoA transferase
MSVTGDVDGEPMKVGIALADVIAGKDAAIAILAALEKRRNGAMTVEERWITISLLDSARAALVNVAQNVLVSGFDAMRWGNAHPNLVPYQLFEASDAPFVIAVGSDAQWFACAESLGLEELARDSSLSTNAGRVEQRRRIVDAIAARVSTNSAAQWVAGLQRLGVPSGVVRSVKQALEGFAASAVYGVASPVGGEMRFPPPRLDEHGAVIRSLGWRAFQR